MLPTKRRTSPRNASHAAIRPHHHASGYSSAVCVSSNMIGRSHGSIMQGTRVLLRSASVASARTQRDTTDFFDHSTTTALAVRSAVLGHLVVGLTRPQADIPPDLEALRARTPPRTASPAPDPRDCRRGRCRAACSRARLRRSVERANGGDVSFERRAVWARRGAKAAPPAPAPTPTGALSRYACVLRHPVQAAHSRRP